MSINESTKNESPPPPYCSFATFSNFLKVLQVTGTPSRIDKSVLSSMSGSSQAALISGLRWLNLIDAQGAPTDRLESLVAAEDDAFPDALRVVLERSYSFLTDGSLQLTKATGGQVESKFREYGITGSTVVKSVAFFIKAAKEAKIPLGPHVKAPKQAGTSSSTKRAARKQQVEPVSPQVAEPARPSLDEDGRLPLSIPGFVRIAVPLHGMKDGAVFLPDKLPRVQWEHALKITKFLIDNYRPQEDAVAAESAPGGAS